jgi:hypothetical protein
MMGVTGFNPATLNLDEGYAGYCIRIIFAHENRKRGKEGIDPAKGSLALKRIKEGNKRGRLTSLTAGLQALALDTGLDQKHGIIGVHKRNKSKKMRK